VKTKALAPPPPVKTSISGIVERSPADLKPWPTNPRTHTDKQLTKLIASIRTFGFTIPVLVDDDGVILSGHGRVQAALKLNLLSIPTRVISGVTEAMKRAYVIADNKLALLSSWDLPLLTSEMALLIESDFEIETTGFSTAEIDLMFPEDSGNPDDLQEEDIVTAVVTRPGDLWQLGTHRLLCGNALEAAAYQTVLDVRAQMVITDPPYNVPIDGHVCGSGKVKHKAFAMASGEMSSSQFTSFLQSALTHLAASVIDGAIVYAFMDWRHGAQLQAAAEPVFGPPRQLCVWVKDNAGMGTFYRSQHELVYVFKKGDAASEQFRAGPVRALSHQRLDVPRREHLQGQRLRVAQAPPDGEAGQSDRRCDPRLQPAQGADPGSVCRKRNGADRCRTHRALCPSDRARSTVRGRGDSALATGD
jgi:hypothetical protein